MGTQPAFEGAGVDIAHKFVRDDNIDDDYIVWKRNEKLDSVAKELVDLHAELEDALNENEHSQHVNYLGNGVCVQ